LIGEVCEEAKKKASKPLMELKSRPTTTPVHVAVVKKNKNCQRKSLKKNKKKKKMKK